MAFSKYDKSDFLYINCMILLVNNRKSHFGFFISKKPHFATHF